jgi:DNA-binding LacI/PurR family transcriptional regulator
VREQGAEAARILFDLIRDAERTPRRVVLPTELIVRTSTAGNRSAWFDRTNHM